MIILVSIILSNQYQYVHRDGETLGFGNPFGNDSLTNTILSSRHWFREDVCSQITPYPEYILRTNLLLERPDLLARVADDLDLWLWLYEDGTQSTSNKEVGGVRW